MKKKSLLTEVEIRKFMKFADLGPLTENFVGALEEREEDWGGDKDDESETHPGEEDYTTKKGGRTETGELAYEDPSKGEETESGAPAYQTEAVLAEEEVDVKELVNALMDVIQDRTGVQISVEEEGGEDLEGGALEGDETEGEEVEAELGGEVGGIGDEVESGETVDVAASEEEEGEEALMEMINKITARVAARLLKEG